LGSLFKNYEGKLSATVKTFFWNDHGVFGKNNDLCIAIEKTTRLSFYHLQHSRRRNAACKVVVSKVHGELHTYPPAKDPASEQTTRVTVSFSIRQ
jgi:hypothetical protein